MLRLGVRIIINEEVLQEVLQEVLWQEVLQEVLQILRTRRIFFLKRRFGTGLVQVRFSSFWMPFSSFWMPPLSPVNIGINC
jgi:hypothetical protein